MRPNRAAANVDRMLMRILSQQVSVSPDAIDIRLISTTRVPDAKVNEVRQNLMRHTGRAVQLSVDAVASNSELAGLMERLGRPAPVAVKEKTVDEMEKELLDRVRPAIQEIWPSSAAPIQDFDVVLGTAGNTIEVNYQAPKDLGEVPIDMVQRDLRTKLGMPDLALKAQRIPQSPPPKVSRRISKR